MGVIINETDVVPETQSKEPGPGRGNTRARPGEPNAASAERTTGTELLDALRHHRLRLARIHAH